MNFTPPVDFKAVSAAFAPIFSRPTFARMQGLVSGMLLTAKGTISAALCMLGFGDDPHFENFHRVFNRACWSALDAARVLLTLLIEAFVPANAALVFGLDETVERRRSPCITARAIYRDAARSSKECVQKTGGLRWMSVHLLVPVRWARRVWALPFLSALCPSKRYAPYADKGRKHKPITRRARGLLSAACCDGWRAPSAALSLWPTTPMPPWSCLVGARSRAGAFLFFPGALP